MTISSTKPRDIAWEKGFAALKKFKEREKHCRVPRAHNEGRFTLGTWVINQRNRKADLSVERRRRLDAIGFVWWTLHEDTWETGLAALKKFKSREGHCLVPRGYKEGSFALGNWVRRQRNRRTTMSPKRRKSLDAIGFVWNPDDVAWENNFAALKHFASREGHCRVPREHNERGLNIGTWITNQRNRKSNLSVERVRRLNTIGFVWRLR
jgi:Helicase associated domain